MQPQGGGGYSVLNSKLPKTGKNPGSILPAASESVSDDAGRAPNGIFATAARSGARGWDDRALGFACRSAIRIAKSLRPWPKLYVTIWSHVKQPPGNEVPTKPDLGYRRGPVGAFP